MAALSIIAPQFIHSFIYATVARFFLLVTPFKNDSLWPLLQNDRLDNRISRMEEKT
jgi:hypothetical protein